MIVPGKATVVNGTVQIKAPFGFNSVAAVRLANYLTNSVLVSGLEGDNQSIHTLLSVQQMVYVTRNVNTPATLMSTGTDTPAAVAAGIVVEWSTDPEHDFVGVYPAQLSVASQTVAQAIFAAGVPLVLNETVLGTYVLPRASGSTTLGPLIDVSAYASLEVSRVALNAPFQIRCGYYRTDDPAFGLTLNNVSVADNLIAAVQLVPVTTKYFVLYNNSTTTDISVTVTGTNRASLSVYDCNGAQGVNLPAKYLLASTAMLAGQTYVVPNVNADGMAQFPTGSCWMSLGLSSGTLARGFFQYQYFAPDTTQQTYNLADSSEMHLDITGGALSLYRMVVLPNMPNGLIVFNCRTAGTTNVFATLVKDCG